MAFPRVGNMTTLVRLFQPVDQADDRGTNAAQYKPDGDLWVELVPIGVGEIRVGDQAAGFATYVAYCHYTDRITNRTVLERKRDGQRFEIVGFSNFEERGQHLELRLREAVD